MNKLNYDANGNARVIERFVENHIRSYEAKVSIIRLGQMLFFTAPAELYTEYAKGIIAKFPKFHVFDMQLTHDCIGYMPTKESVLHGGYSAERLSAFCDHVGCEVYVFEVCDGMNRVICD